MSNTDHWIGLLLTLSALLLLAGALVGVKLSSETGAAMLLCGLAAACIAVPWYVIRRLRPGG